jgi:hypothetical protein
MLFAAFGVLGVVLLGSLAHLRRRQDSLGLPVVAVFVFGFLYFVDPLYLWWTGKLEVFLTPEQAVKGILMPAMMLPCFLAGWGRRSRRRCVPAKRAVWEPRVLFRWGLGTATLGSIIFCIFVERAGGVFQYFSKPHQGAAVQATLNTTAYLYSTPFWILSGCAMMILAWPHMRQGWATRTPVVVLIGLMYAYSLLASLRGMLFATTSCLLVSLCLAKRWRPSLSQVLLGLAVVGLGVGLIGGYRGVLHLGEEMQEAPPVEEALKAYLVIDETHTRLRTTGNEFIYHALAIDTVDATAKYHLALNWIWAVTVHVIPRIWWPGKPYGWQTGGITWADIAAHTGVSMAGGSAPGIVGDTYTQFGMFSVVFFFVFGRIARKIYERALDLTSPLGACAYIMLHAMSLNTFAQGFGALPTMFVYSLGPVALFTFLGSRKTSGWRTDRRAPMVAWQPAEVPGSLERRPRGVA